MKNLLCTLLPALSLILTGTNSLQAAEDHTVETMMTITDFTDRQDAIAWFIQNDSVMGGKSSGEFTVENEQLTFTGFTNTDGGGFSSVQTRPLQLDLSKHEGIRLNVKADGRRYTWHIQTDAMWRGRRISYWADFDTGKGRWIIVDIPFSSFKPRSRGTLLDGPALDLTNIQELGLYIYDRQDGNFKLHLESVAAYSSD